MVARCPYAAKGSVWDGPLVVPQHRRAGEAAAAARPGLVRADLPRHPRHHPPHPRGPGAVPQHQPGRRPCAPRRARCGADGRRRLHRARRRPARLRIRYRGGALRHGGGPRPGRVRADPASGRRLLDRGGDQERRDRHPHRRPGRPDPRRVPAVRRQRAVPGGVHEPRHRRTDRGRQLPLRARRAHQGQGPDGDHRRLRAVRRAVRRDPAGPAALALGPALLPQPAPGAGPRPGPRLPPRPPLVRLRRRVEQFIGGAPSR